MTINHTNNEQNGEFVAFEGEEKLGYISYEWVDADHFAIVHTVVSPEHKGKGIGKILLDAAADYARKNNKKNKRRMFFLLPCSLHGAISTTTLRANPYNAFLYWHILQKETGRKLRQSRSTVLQ